MMNFSKAENELHSLDFDNLIFPFSKYHLQNLPPIRYRGEGNANLIMSLPDIKFVMRFEKSSRALDRNAKIEESKFCFLYRYIFIARILSDGFNTIVPVLAQMPQKYVLKLEKLVSRSRPEYRKAKGVSSNIIEIYPDCAFLPEYRKYVRLNGDLDLIEAPGTASLRGVLSRDYLNYRNFVFSFLTDLAFRDRYLCIFPNNHRERSTWCVEIKPKQGWVAFSDRLPGKCMFCMNQYLKMNDKKIKNRSHYCPLDLFSGNLDRMRRAIEGLLETPQNNLRIFENGTLVFGGDISNNKTNMLSTLFNDEDINRCTRNFSHLIVKILTHESTNHENKMTLCCKTVDTNIKPPDFPSDLIEFVNISQPRCTYEQSTLSGFSILSCIYNMQKLDQVGLKEVVKFYESHISEYKSDFDYIYDLVSRIELENEKEKVILNVLESYLCAAVAWDLSILIAMQVSTDQEHSSAMQIKDANGIAYEVNVTVVDVGPKPISCIKKHQKRNADILDSFLKYHRVNLSGSDFK